MMTKPKFEPVPCLSVVSMSADSAREFFGAAPSAWIVDAGPVTDRPERYDPAARVWHVFTEGKPQISDKQHAMLARLVLGGGMLHVMGAQVETVRRLDRLGLATLEDCGRMGPGGNWDGERWIARITAAGRALV